MLKATFYKNTEAINSENIVIKQFKKNQLQKISSNKKIKSTFNGEDNAI